MGTEPDYVLAAAREAKISMATKCEDKIDKVVSMLDQPVPKSLEVDPAWIPFLEQDLDSKAAVARAAMRAWSVSELEDPLPSPDVAPEGWVSRTGPNGQKYWHNMALGPAPW